jgi:hypothetical protein
MMIGRRAFHNLQVSIINYLNDLSISVRTLVADIISSDW